MRKKYLRSLKDLKGPDKQNTEMCMANREAPLHRNLQIFHDIFEGLSKLAG